MGEDRVTRSGSDESGPVLDRRRLLGALAAAAGVAGCSGGGDETPTDGGELTWPHASDPYYGSLVQTLRDDHDLPPAEFVYAESESETFDAYEVHGDADVTSLDVSDDGVPFSEAARVTVTSQPANPWDVTMKGDVQDLPVTENDVLLGIVHLRGPADSETTPTTEYLSKDEDNMGTNMVRAQSQVAPGEEWARYYFPIAFEYDSEPGTWWTELFFGFCEQTVDVGGLALLYFGPRIGVEALPRGVAAVDGSGVTGDGDGDVTEDGESREWEPAVDERIRDHRTADLTVDVLDAEGNPVDGADVSVAMQEHEFGFGVAIDAEKLVNSDEDDEYPSTVTDLFNTAVLGNHHKWRFWEENRDLSDAATDWLLDRGLRLRGHTCLWANVSGWAVPPDVVEAMGVEWEDGGVTDPELDPEHVETRTKEHVREIIEYYGDRIEEWDVVNEVLHEPGFIRAVNGVPADQPMQDVDPVEAPILREWYDIAREAAPEGVTLATNDYNTLAGPYPGPRDRYERQIEFLASDGDRVDSVGMQCHFSGSETLTSGEIMEGLDRYAAHDVRLRITEFDMADEYWDEDDKADFFYEFLKTVFSHPAVDDFLVWGHWDGAHWRDDAPFYSTDWEPKPALEVYRTLVFEEWWTEETTTTDGDGTATVTGFRGEYEVTATVDGETVAATVTLPADGASVELQPE